MSSNQCSIASFRTALQFSDQYIAQPRNIRANLATITRSRHFVECEAVIDYRPAIIYAPISSEAMGLALAAKRCCSPSHGDITHIEIYHNALQVALPHTTTCSIIVEYLPEQYVPLRELIYMSRRATLTTALEELRRRMMDYGFSHNNLHIDNIVVDDHNRWYPIRLYYATLGMGGDDMAFDALRAEIKECAMSDDICSPILNEDFAPYDISSHQHRVEPLIENRRRLYTTQGYGFMDESGRVVIEPQYASVENFTEGRAVVRSAEGRAGVIDRNGREIVALAYDRAIFVEESASIWLSLDGRWVEFDYNGKQIGEWCDKPPYLFDED